MLDSDLTFFLRGVHSPIVVVVGIFGVFFSFPLLVLGGELIIRFISLLLRRVLTFDNNLMKRDSEPLVRSG